VTDVDQDRKGEFVLQPAGAHPTTPASFTRSAAAADQHDDSTTTQSSSPNLSPRPPRVLAQGGA
jgi:hypothetical protein